MLRAATHWYSVMFSIIDGSTMESVEMMEPLGLWRFELAGHGRFCCCVGFGGWLMSFGCHGIRCSGESTEHRFLRCDRSSV